MAKFFNTFVLLSVAVCVMLATSAPTVHVRRCSSDCEENRNAVNLNFILGVGETVSFSDMIRIT